MDEIAAWVRKQAEADAARAQGAGVFVDHPRTEAARAESVLAVLDLYEKALDAEASDLFLRDLSVPTLRQVVRLLAFGYRHRDGWQETWKP